MDPISPPDLANAVTGFCTVLAGLMALALSLLMGGQPRRWLVAYAGIFVTGVPTVWYHGFGEAFWPGTADIGTNLLLAWLLQVAALGDGYRPATRRWVATVTGLINLAYLAWKIVVGPADAGLYPIRLGEFGGFKLGEVLLILNSLLAVGLLYGRRRHHPRQARPLLYLTTAIFVVGLLLASAFNQQVDGRIVAYHALWHVVGAFGFIALWAFNQARFSHVAGP